MDWPGCGSCKHLHRRKPGKWTCEAFPRGIPMPIASGHIDHLHAIDGDNGIQFELRHPEEE